MTPSVLDVLRDLFPAFLVGLAEDLWKLLVGIWKDPSSWSLGVA